MKSMKEIENRIGYQFREKSVLRSSLTHSSYANEHRETTGLYNERLEFLGDSVLSLLVTEYLFLHYKDLPEGELTKIRAGVVCEAALHSCAKGIALGEALFLGRGEEQNGGRERPSILADAFEALIAAVYLDGGFDTVKKVIFPMLEGPIHAAAEGKLNKDYKTMLQEIVQKNKEEKLSYRLVSQSGPDHDKVFSVEILLNSNVFASGKGRSKKEAEQAAAKEALSLMGAL